MRKLRIRIDALQVETFVTDAVSRGHTGTVNGNGREPQQPIPTDDTTGGTGGSGNIFCISAYPCVPTNEHSCQGTCYASCNGTCAPAGQLCA